MTGLLLLDVVEWKGDVTEGHGTWEFACVPRKGDHVRVYSAAPGLQILRVLCVEHYPVRHPKGPMTRPMPTMTVFAEHLKWEEDD